MLQTAQDLAINLEPHKPPSMAKWNHSQHAFHRVPQFAFSKAVSLAFLPGIHLSEIIPGNTQSRAWFYGCAEPSVEGWAHLEIHGCAPKGLWNEAVS